MPSHGRPALVLLIVFTLATGFAYPLIVTGLSRALLPDHAAGSLVVRDGTIVGSALLGQPFDDPGYFWGRPSATAGRACDAAASAGSNLGPCNPALLEAVRTRIAALRAADPGTTAPVPIDLVTASGSGLDPHISPAAALFQVGRVARARGFAEETVRALVAGRIEGRQLGLLGEPRVNVLLLNLALDEIGRGR